MGRGVGGSVLVSQTASLPISFFPTQNQHNIKKQALLAIFDAALAARRARPEARAEAHLLWRAAAARHRAAAPHAPVLLTQLRAAPRAVLDRGAFCGYVLARAAVAGGGDGSGGGLGGELRAWLRGAAEAGAREEAAVGGNAAVL